MDEAARLRRNEYQRQWRANNPEKWAATIERFRNNNPGAGAEAMRRWRVTNYEKELELKRLNYDPERQRARKIRYRSENPERVRDMDLKQKWKELGYPEPTRPRPESCEVCGGDNGAKRLHLDHSHTTGEFRGWLCMKCNMALGLLNDSLDLLRALTDYLERN